MRSRSRVLCLGLCRLAAVVGLAAQQDPPEAGTAASVFSLPQREELHYRAEWRLIHAGNARLLWQAGEQGNGWQAALKLESAGLVSRLYRVNNEYLSDMDGGLCATASLLKANEGSKRRETRVSFDAERGKASYLERDLVKKTVVDAHEIDIPGCVHDVIGGLYRLRTLRLEPGQSVRLPISDGKKSVLALVEAQEREPITVAGVRYQTVRYEAFLFNNVLYRRRGRLFVWLTDDDRRLPVRIRVRLPFYIGTVTLDLQPPKQAVADPSKPQER